MPADDRLHLGLLDHPTRHLFFTGKGGVGKTSLACAVALSLADDGKRVLIVSTDPASNLDEMLEVRLGRLPVPIPGAPSLFAMNIDPEAAAAAYRTRVLSQMDGASEEELSTTREQLSGACTTEIAAFDEFVGLLAGDASAYDHVVFDTAPTGHTLRLLSLPKAWTGFLAENDRGASCLGPHSGLKMQEARFLKAMETLADAASTTVVLVTRPDAAAVREAARTSAELGDLGLANQRLVVNGMFRATGGDPIATALENRCASVMADLPIPIRGLPRDTVPLRAYDMVGLTALRALLGRGPAPVAKMAAIPARDGTGEEERLNALVEQLAAPGRGLVLVMGKGGVGKTTVAASIAVGLTQRGHAVHLSTTDPAAHLASTIAGSVAGLTVDRIDPKVETAAYVEKIMRTRGRTLDADELALLREDLESPCTEEVAVFHAFSRIVAEARSAFVVLDTAPTGHTLLLMDAAGAYHRQMTRAQDPEAPGRLITPLMRIKDPDYCRVVLVALPEVTPVSEAAALQDDLRRAGIEPYAWVMNRCLSGSGTRDPLLLSRLAGERAQIDRVRTRYARRLFSLPWQEAEPVGVAALTRLVA
jgi:arsenite-transporting ATPase